MPVNKLGHFYYGWYPTVFHADTLPLNLAEKGAYRGLIDHYMVSRKPIPENDRSISKILAVGLDEWLEVKENVLKYFKLSDGFYFHSFCERELEENVVRIQRARENGVKGGRPKKNPEETQSVFDEKPSGLSVGFEKITQQKANQINQIKSNQINKSEKSDQIKQNPANHGDDDSFIFNGIGLDDDGYDILKKIKEQETFAKAMKKTRYDLGEVADAFNQMIRNGGDPPNSPDGAFIKFCEGYDPNKGKRKRA